MSRKHRVDVGGVPYHVINRANARVRIFDDIIDYSDFEYLLKETKETFGIRILAYVIMPNHWHLLVCPKKDGDLSKCMHWLGSTHARRHHARHGTIGEGHLYQGRYKSFPIRNDRHLLTVLKYVERNPVRANLSDRAEYWQWGSAHQRANVSGDRSLLDTSLFDLPKDYTNWINTPEPAEEIKAIRHSVENEVSYEEVGQY